MVRKDLVRKTPGAWPVGECGGKGSSGDADDAPSAPDASDAVCHDSSSAFCAGKPGRSLPAGVFLAMAAAATGNRVCAFAPMSHPAERAAFATRARWPQLIAPDENLASSVGLVSGLRRRGRGKNKGDDGCDREQKTWLASASREQPNPDPNSDATRPPGSGNSLPARNSRTSENRKQQWRRGEARRLHSKRMTAEGGSGSEGGGFFRSVQGRGQGTDKNGRKEVAGLWELVEYRGGDGTEEDETSPSTATNKTELSQKVEAELFQEYDAMVPGPASSSTVTVEGVVDGRGGGGEKMRTGRPLAINLDLLSYRAKQKVIKGDYAAAQKLYRDCVELDPRDGRGWLGLARQMQKKQKFDKARRLFEVGLENCVDNPYLLQAFAVMEEQRGNQAKALNLLNRSVRVHPEHTASWVALGLLNERGERIDEARACFETATKNDPKNYYAWLVWGMLEKRFGSTAEAREKFKTCLRVNPRNSKVYQAWGVLESEEENYELAAELFRAGLEQQPGNTFVMQAWALMEARRGDRDCATRLLKQAIVERPKDGAVWQAYALLLKDEGDVIGARALFKKGVEQAPKHSPIWQAWGMMEWQLGNVSAARKIFQDGVWETPRGPNVVRILQAWAILEASELNYHDARKYFGFALARDPYSIPVMVAWALMEERLGDISRARQLLEMATETQPWNVEIWNVYEQVEYRGGFYAEANAVYERRGTALKGVEDNARGGGIGGKTWWGKTSSSGSRSSRGMSSLLDQASRSLGTSSAEMAQRVSRIVGGVQWASDYMSFSALSGGLGGEIALEP